MYGEEPSTIEYLIYGSFTVVCIVCFLLSVFNIMNDGVRVLNGSFLNDDDDDHKHRPSVASITPPPVIKQPPQPPKRKPVVTKQDWDEIVLTAIEQAKNGNASARSFLLKNNLLPSSPMPSQAKNKTPNSVIKDTVNGLVSLGYSKSEATSMVTNACASKVYSSASELISDIIKSP